MGEEGLKWFAQPSYARPEEFHIRYIGLPANAKTVSARGLADRRSAVNR